MIRPGYPRQNPDESDAAFRVRRDRDAAQVDGLKLIPATLVEAYLLHRHTLHGVAPWKPGDRAPEQGRMIAFFRPKMPGGLTYWLTAP